uniref:Type IV pilus assembly protein PilC n=1 Tax=Candidatus Kentrum sp. MB TaxID=2138164 RepID=A0A450XK70_9GAMM|nr:MAG: type IV pilus assembly protein PilC [Candidatus Kentron sp. MB]VFK33828.1 MAG: type IV pilus assembly protein PilC [Candidatus Kentron sp. MB]VFK76421.1 MAG: type IV pilus assembly protein PilC [Candidatus Kentron sp. MB]
MPLLRYKAMDATGKIRVGQMEAANAVDLELHLDHMGLELIRSKEIKQRILPGARIVRRDLISFCFHLEQLITAGVPLLEGLGDLRDSVEEPRLRQVLTMLMDHIEGGKTLSEAMEAFPHVFDRTLVMPIRAGESSGQLEQVLRNIIANLKWIDETASQVKKLFLYPAIVGSVVTAITFFLMIYLVPKLISFFEMMGQTLPAHTRFLIAASDFFTVWWHLILIGPILGFIVVKALVAVSPPARILWDAFSLRVWIVGPIRKKIILSRFANYFALLYASGITVLDCLRISESLIGNKAMEMAIRRAAHRITEGVGISTAFEHAGLFPPLVLRMLRVGENTGALDVALRNVSYFYDRDVRESIGRLQTLIEPTMTTVLGVLLGWIMISVLGPMYDLIANLEL